MAVTWRMGGWHECGASVVRDGAYQCECPTAIMTSVVPYLIRRVKRAKHRVAGIHQLPMGMGTKQTHGGVVCRGET